MRDNQAVEDSFSILILGVVVAAVVTMLVVLILSGRESAGGSVYDQIGEGGISQNSEASDWTSAPVMSSTAEQEREIRQMLSAKSERLVQSGKPALDIDGEVAKLLAPQQGSHDAGLEDEVRQLVTAKNERRVRRGLGPLDIATEVQRTLAELDP
jgi:hypothetical protein